MPKILINEVNNTSAGTPGRYGNYSVLLTGYMGTPDPTKGNVVEPDSNGVYEFNSAGDFIATIGLFEKNEDEIASVAKKDSKGNIVEYHYGNRMAVELLNLGYQIIYKVIDKVSDMDSELFWEIFKDKANYDFRFISHGMLETCYDAAAHTALYARLDVIKEALAKLENIKKEATKAVQEDSTIVFLEECQDRFEELLKTDSEIFVDNAGTAYSNFVSAAGIDAKDATGETVIDNAGLPADLEEQEARITEHNAKHFTITTFNNINGHIAKLATYHADDTAAIPGRGDCIALIELDEDIYHETGSSKRPEELIIEGINSMTTITETEGKYCAMTVPSVYYKGIGKFPGAFHYLACFMNSLRSGFAEWYAAAGYNRGVSSYVIDYTTAKLGEIAINALEPRNIKDQSSQPKFACNVIANFRGSYYLWGNRTAAGLKSASGGGDLTADHFLNIRQLCSTIKKQLYVACRRFTFDPNSDTLWFNFVNAITPTLDAMKADQGIGDYKVVKVATDKKATLKARIRIIPIEAVEDFDITVSLEDSFGDVSVTAEG